MKFYFALNLNSSLNEQAKKLPISKYEQKCLIVKLLVDDYEFDIGTVEKALFNMLGMVVGVDTTQDLNSEQKQEFFKLARAPVEKLQLEYDTIRRAQSRLLDTDSDEWNNYFEQLEEIKRKLNVARENAARDIFERTNSRGNMGSIIESDSESKSSIFIDLHGLFINEAKERVNEFILPILPVLKKMAVITGRGSHSQSGESQLKKAMQDYFTSMKYKCVEVANNKGALCVYAKESST